MRRPTSTTRPELVVVLGIQSSAALGYGLAGQRRLRSSSDAGVVSTNPASAALILAGTNIVSVLHDDMDVVARGRAAVESRLAAEQNSRSRTLGKVRRQPAPRRQS